MQIPFLWLSIGLMAGILAVQFQEVYGPIFLSVTAAICVCLSLKSHRVRLLAVMTTVAAVSCFYTHACIHPAQSDWDQWVTTRLNDHSSLWTQAEGIVSGVPVIKQQGRKKKIQLILSAEKIIPAAENTPAFQLNREKIQVFIYQPEKEILPGDFIRLRGRLKRPGQALNPGQFDYRRFLYEQGIDSILECYGDDSFQVLRSDKKSVRAVIGRMRMRLRNLIEQRYSGLEGKILISVIAGMRDGVPYELREAFARTGTAHILPWADGKRAYPAVTGGITL
ncbi:MAG: DUF4131 domain-containing protein [Candidatus Omnitrophica bacterium]|nr:DUF4131 domain-containing protein [Candidatus Omnitrophota bacterium]